MALLWTFTRGFFSIVFVVHLVACDVGNRPITYRQLREIRDHLQRQIDSLREDTKTEINMIKDDLKIMFDNGHIPQTLAPAVDEDKAKERGEKTKMDESVDIEKYITLADRCKEVLVAFSIEKAMNVQLRNNITAMETTMKREFGQMKVESKREIEEFKQNAIQDVNAWKNLATKDIMKEKEVSVKIATETKKEVKDIISKLALTKQLENVKGTLQLEIRNSKDEMNQTINTFYNGLRDEIRDQCISPLKTVNEAINKTQASIQVFMDRFHHPTTECLGLPRRSGIRDIYLDHLNKTIPVFCDQDTDGGGWIVVQRRSNAEKDTWAKSGDDKRVFETGFGDLTGDFWIGIDNIIALLINKTRVARLEMVDTNGNKYVGTFENCNVTQFTQFSYQITTGNFNGSDILSGCINVGHIYYKNDESVDLDQDPSKFARNWPFQCFFNSAFELLPFDYWEDYYFYLFDEYEFYPDILANFLNSKMKFRSTEIKIR